MGLHNVELYNNLGLSCFYAQQYDMTLACMERALEMANDESLGIDGFHWWIKLLLECNLNWFTSKMADCWKINKRTQFLKEHENHKNTNYEETSHTNTSFNTNII